MENQHKERGFAEIAQNFTTFPDGKIMGCRNINFVPAGIKGATPLAFAQNMQETLIKIKAKMPLLSNKKIVSYL